MQSPNDWEATYRRKKGEDHQGYVANVTETCDPENKLQMITNVQVEPNTTDDAAMLEETIPDLAKNKEVKEIYVDGGYGSPKVNDEVLQQHNIDLFQTALTFLCLLCYLFSSSAKTKFCVQSYPNRCFFRGLIGPKITTQIGVVVTRTTELATVVNSKDEIQDPKWTASKPPEKSAQRRSNQVTARSSRR